MTTINTIGTINISYSSANVYYNINDGINNIISSWPVSINNSDTSTTLKVLFITDVTLTTSNPFLYDKLYFECGTNNIQFGDSSLKPDGTRPIITIKDIPNYPGLIKNYDPYFLSSYNNIYVYNLFVKSVGSTLVLGGGWIGQENYSNNTTSYFINCSSDGDIPVNGGGIIGYACGANGGNLIIIGCSSSGNIDINGGGIVGKDTGYNGSYRISNCFSTGPIGFNAGGIVGYGTSGISLTVSIIENCYSSGIISLGGGGITGTGVANITVSNCYSLGNVLSGAGGIYGDGSNINTTANNCYAANGTNIYAGTSGIIQNCYTANGSWSDVTANSLLQPSYWISVVSNTPFYLKSFGGSPYTLANIVANNIVQTYSASLNPGDLSIAAPVAGYKTFQIMSGGDPTITIDNTGVITTTATTPSGTYTLILYAVDDYTTTTFILEVIAPIPIPIGNILAQSIPPCCEPNVPQSNPQVTNYDSDVITNKKGGKALDKSIEDFYVGVATGQRTAYSQPIFKSYHDYMNYLQGKYK
jgi:hypothetical protein